MRNAFLMALMLLVTSPAFAIHAYRSEYCKGAKLLFNYVGTSPIGGAYSLRKIGEEPDDENGIRGFSDDEDETPGELGEGTDFTFTELKSKTIGKEKTEKDGAWDHTEWKSKKIVKIKLISEKAQKQLGLRPGSLLKLRCSETTDYPN